MSAHDRPDPRPPRSRAQRQPIPERRTLYRRARRAIQSSSHRCSSLRAAASPEPAPPHAVESRSARRAHSLVPRQTRHWKRRASPPQRTASKEIAVMYGGESRTAQHRRAPSSIFHPPSSHSAKPSHPLFSHAGHDLIDADAEIIVEDEHFTARDEPFIHEYVHRIARQLVELNHRAFRELQHIFHEHPRAPQLYLHVQIHIAQDID